MLPTDCQGLNIEPVLFDERLFWKLKSQSKEPVRT